MSNPLPQVLQPLPEGVDGEDVDNADEVALLRSVDDVQRILEVGQQASVLGPEVWGCVLRAWMRTSTVQGTCCWSLQEVCFRSC